MRTHLIASRALAALFTLTTLTTLTGCDKLKSAMGRGDGEGGVATADTTGMPLPFASGFEGEVGIMMKGKPAAHTKEGAQAMTLEVKSDKIRLDLPAGMAGTESAGGGAMYVIVNTPEKKLYAVMDAKKEAMVFDLNKADALKSMGGPHVPPPAGGPATPPPAPPKITKTGKMESVAGYTCEDWNIDQDGKKTVACIAQQGASWFHLPITGIPTEHAWAAELMDGKHFPLRFVAYAKDGTEETRIEVTRIDKKTLAATRFEVPAGYKIIDLAQMMQGLGNMPTMPPGRMH